MHRYAISRHGHWSARSIHSSSRLLVFSSSVVTFLDVISLSQPAAVLLFWSAAVISLVAQAMVLRAAFAGRTPAASKSTGGKARELIWIVLPALTLVVLLWFTWRAVARRAEASTPVPALAVARQAAPDAWKPTR